MAACKDLGPPDRSPPDRPRPDAAADAAAPDLVQDDLATWDLPYVPDKLQPPDKPPAPDASLTDAPGADLLPPDAAVGDTGISCKIHHDCPQKWFCYLGQCIIDPKMDVFHCGKPGCPPGHWCVNSAGKKTECAEDKGHACKDACDCGPAHCCKGGVCVKDIIDPWKPGGTAIGPACAEGVDATYCCSEPECHSGRFAFGGNADRFFRCHSRASNKTERTCGGASCFGTACNCGPGESCVDTTSQMPPGKTCLLLSGGTCVSNAAATEFYGFGASDLLSCCSKSCLPGSKCDAGWRSDPKYGYVRVVASCGACGNGKCDPGENPKTCPQDCTCGDTVCSPQENYKVRGTTYSYSISFSSCSKDCKTWSNGKCEPWESPWFMVGSECLGCGSGWCTGTETLVSCAQDCGGRCVDASLYPGLHRVCGDGLCETAKSDEVETCKTCPQDCGPCDPGWVHERRAEPWLGEGLNAAWGSSPSSVWVVGDNGTILHYDGTKWNSHISSLNGRYGVNASYALQQFKLMNLHDVWGVSPTEIYAVGGRTCNSSSTTQCDLAVLRYDGKRWEPIHVAGGPALGAVWAGGGQIFALSTKGNLLHYDGNTWSSPTPKQTYLTDVWGTSPSNVYAVGLFGKVLRFDGSAWNTVNSGSSSHFQAVWGSSASDVYVVGYSGAVVRFDGQGWAKMPGIPKQSLLAVSGSSATNVYVSGANGTNLRYDGTQWINLGLPPVPPGVMVQGKTTIHGLWVHPGGVFATAGRKYGCSGKVCTAGIFRFDQQKSAWSTIAQGFASTLNDVWSSAAGQAVAVGTSCGLNATKGKCAAVALQRKGAQWVPMGPVPGAGLHAVWGSGASDHFAVGYQGTIVRHDGTKWQAMNSGAGSAALYGVWGSSPSNVFAVGAKGIILRFNGSKWTPMASGTSANLTAVHGFSPTAVFAASDQGQVLRFDGSGWKPTNTQHTHSLSALWGTSPTDLYAGGSNTFLLRYDGSQWTSKQLTSSMGIVDIWGLPGGETYLALGGSGKVGHLLRSSPKGWVRVPLDLRYASALSYETPVVMGLTSSPAGELLAVGHRELILRRCAGGKCP